MDNHTRQQRSHNMARISSNNTKPEKIVRSFLFANGLRYRKNVKKLYGCPDIVIKKYSTIVFVNGCFWHKHDCSEFVMPKSNTEYWLSKINRNKERDDENICKLKTLGWQVIVIWECQLNKKMTDTTLNNLLNAIMNNVDKYS